MVIIADARIWPKNFTTTTRKLSRTKIQKFCTNFLSQICVFCLLYFFTDVVYYNYQRDRVVEALNEVGDAVAISKEQLGRPLKKIKKIEKSA